MFALKRNDVVNETLTYTQKIKLLIMPIRLHKKWHVGTMLFKHMLEMKTACKSFFTFLVNGHNFRGNTCHFHLCLPSSQGSTCKRKNLFHLEQILSCSIRSNFFALPADPFWSGFLVQENKKEIKNLVSL